MAYTLKFEHPHFPDGKEFAINFLGSVENGGTLEIDEDAERAFLANHGRGIEDAFSNNSLVTISGSSALTGDETEQLLEQNSEQTEETPAPAEGVTENG